MAADLVILAEAYQDIDEAYAWYEQQRIGLGEDFLTCLDACLAATVRHPQLHACVLEDFRRVLIRRFPYAVFYEYIGDTVTVYGVMHTARDPQKWRRRLP